MGKTKTTTTMKYTNILFILLLVLSCSYQKNLKEQVQETSQLETEDQTEELLEVENQTEETAEEEAEAETEVTSEEEAQESSEEEAVDPKNIIEAMKEDSYITDRGMNYVLGIFGKVFNTNTLTYDPKISLGNLTRNMKEKVKKETKILIYKYQYRLNSLFSMLRGFPAYLRYRDPIRAFSFMLKSYSNFMSQRALNDVLFIFGKIYGEKEDSHVGHISATTGRLTRTQKTLLTKALKTFIKKHKKRTENILSMYTELFKAVNNKSHFDVFKKNLHGKPHKQHALNDILCVFGKIFQDDKLPCVSLPLNGVFTKEQKVELGSRFEIFEKKYISKARMIFKTLLGLKNSLDGKNKYQH